MVAMDEIDLIWPLAPLTVVNMASSLSQKCIVIDCRSFLSFNAAHIRGSLNVHCPPILKRRLHRGTSTLDCLLTSPESKRRLADAETLILYEDRTQDWKDLEMDNTMKIIYMLLRRERINKNLYFIKGKFCSSITASLLLTLWYPLFSWPRVYSLWIHLYRLIVTSKCLPYLGQNFIVSISQHCNQKEADSRFIGYSSLEWKRVLW